MTQELYDYIKREMERGVNRTSIKESLLSAGWQENVIDEAFNKMSGSAPMPSSGTFPSFINILKNSWGVYKTRFFSLGVMAVLPYLFGGILAFLFFGQLFIQQIFAGGLGLSLAILSNLLLFVVFFLIFIVLNFINYSASVYLVGTPQANIFSAYKSVFKRFGSFLWLPILTAFVVLGGYLLFVIPGVIFSFWFMFALFILALEGDKGRDALLKSREYMRGVSGKVIRFIFLLVILEGILGYIAGFAFKLFPKEIAGVLSWVLNVFIFFPFTLAFISSMYQSLRSAKGQISVAQKSKTWITIFGILGPLFIVGMVLLGISGFSFFKNKLFINPQSFNLKDYESVNLNTLNNSFSEEQSNSLLNWKTYINDKYGFEFKYPSTYQSSRLYTSPNDSVNETVSFDGPEGDFYISLQDSSDQFKGKSEKEIISSSLCNISSVYGEKIKSNFITINNTLFYELWIGNYVADRPSEIGYPKDASITYCFLGKNGGLFSLYSSPSLDTEEELNNFSDFLKSILSTVILFDNN